MLKSKHLALKSKISPFLRYAGCNWAQINANFPHRAGVVELADTPGLEPGAARHRGSSPFFRKLTRKLMIYFAGVIFFAAGCGYTTQPVKFPARIYFELERLTEGDRGTQGDLAAQKEPANIATIFGGATIMQPTGARFPVVTVTNTAGGQSARWSLNDSQRSDSQTELSALRIAPDNSRLAIVVRNPGKLNILREIDLQSGLDIRAPIENIFDVVYLSDGSLLATRLRNQQPRSAIQINGANIRVVYEAQARGLLSLSVKTPEYINITEWNSTPKVFNVRTAQLSNRVKSQPQVNFSGCATMKTKHCRDISVLSADGTSVPVTVIGPVNGDKLQAPVSVRVYGAYGMNVGNALTPREIYLLHHGATVVFAHVRGGGELGPKWHTAGAGALRENGVQDLIAVLKNFAGRPLILNASSAGAIVAIAATAATAAIAGTNASPQLVSALVLDSPLLDISQTIARFADDAAEFANTPPQIFPLHIAAQAKLPPILLLCGTLDPLVDVAACLSFKALNDQILESGEIALWHEERDFHGAPLSRPELLEREARILNFLSAKIRLFWAR